MPSFEIQDIAYQNKDGISFRALDKSTGQIVSLRRFFPFGQDEDGGVGLDLEEGKAFTSACKRLSEISHPALRKTIFGDTDPIDGMPYIVTEWVDGGSPLADILGNHTMDPIMIIGLVRQALDVCMTLSINLESEAVWIDTKLEAIIVSNPEENPTFTFRICPLKWLGIQSHHKDLTGIVSLVKALMGWKTKLYNDQAGHGLGSWIKRLSRSPEMSLKEALECMPSQNAEYVIETKLADYNQPPQAFILDSSNHYLFTKKRVIVMATSACATAALIIFLYQKKQLQLASDAVVPNELQAAARNIKNETAIVEPIEGVNPNKNEDLDKISQKPNQPLTASQMIDAKAIRMSEELLKDKVLKAEQEEALKLGPIALTYDDLEKIQKMESNIPVKIQGIVKSVEIPTNRKVLHIAFSNPVDKGQIRVILYPREFDEGRFKNNFKSVEKKYQNLLNENVVFIGVTNKFPIMKNPAFVRVESDKDIKIVKH